MIFEHVYNFQGRYSQQLISNEPNGEKYIEKGEVTSLLNSLNFAKQVPNNFRLYFTEDAVFPRERLRQYGKDKNITITRSPEKANLIVTDINKIKALVSSHYVHRIYKLDKDKFITASYHRLENEPGIKDRVEDPVDTYIMSALPFDFAFYNAHKGATFIDTRDLNAQCNLTMELTHDVYKNLDTMMSSDDEEVFRIGVNLFAACNHNQRSLYYTSILWHKYINRVKQNPSLWNSVNLRAFRAFAEGSQFTKYYFNRKENIEFELFNYLINDKQTVYTTREFIDTIIQKNVEKVEEKINTNGIFALDISVKYEILPEHINYVKFEEDDATEEASGIPGNQEQG